MHASPNSLRAALPALLGASVLLSGCGGSNTDSHVEAPGAQKTVGTRALDSGAAALQDRPPIDAINAYLDGFHFYSGAMQAQMEAHHYCAVLNEELIQCVIYDGNMKDAKLMGVEYIVSERLFRALPAEEKKLWHSHVHEVKSGQLVAPGIPEPAERALMAKLVNTYGKTWHTWHTDREKTLPLGVPQLMMGFTADGQVDEAMVAARNQRLGINSDGATGNRFPPRPWPKGPTAGSGAKPCRSRRSPTRHTMARALHRRASPDDCNWAPPFDELAHARRACRTSRCP